MSTQSDKSLTVADVMLTMDACPVADERTILKEVLEAMDKHRLGVVCIVDQANLRDARDHRFQTYAPCDDRQNGYGLCGRHHQETDGLRN